MSRDFLSVSSILQAVKSAAAAASYRYCQLGQPGPDNVRRTHHETVLAVRML